MLTGQPPFDTIMTNKDILASQMAESVGSLPDRWEDCYTAPSHNNDEDSSLVLEELLAELYFDEGKKPELSETELEAWARLLKKLLRLETSERATATEILQEDCLK